MPVLDAKALEVDPKGMAFLKSILRPLPASGAPPKDSRRIARVRFHVLRRSRELIAGTV